MLESTLHALYADVPAAKARYEKSMECFCRLYGHARGNNETAIVSAPGRTEIGGNHTDHQNGLALAAAVDMDVVCVCAKNDDDIIRIHSAGFKPATVDLSVLSVQENEKGTSAGLVRGLAAWFASKGYPVGGFDAYVTSTVPGGSGLSSSAAFEVAIGNAFKALFCDDAAGRPTPIEIAIAGKYAENVYFGKPCGLLDQIASSLGGLIMIDFADPTNPRVENVPIVLTGYELCITDTKGSHADLTPEYAAVPREMGMIAGHFGKRVLREVPPGDFFNDIAALREYGDRAVLRAMHFFRENERVGKQAAALRAGNLEAFFAFTNESGRSSASLLQNIFPAGAPQSQGVSLALALSDRALDGHGACRVHGGGFAGTIQAYVPLAAKDEYRSRMERVFGNACCHFLKIRASGGAKVVA